VKRVKAIRATVLGAALIAIPLAVSAATAGDGVKPGYWETTSRVLSPIHSIDTERRCVTREQVRKFMSCYINHHYDCVCDEDVVGAGRVSFKGQCADRKTGSKVGVSGVGSYTDTTLTMSADATFKLLGIPVAGKATIDARRLSDTCPAGAP
jgi:hypothetical protein